jgi:uncharacterized damage-inducible protein DinB
MTLREHLLQGFEYDLWANERWLAPARELGLESILEHIVAAQERWLSRCNATTIDMPGNRLDVRLEAAVAAWIAFVSNADLEREVAYSTSAGEEHRQTVADIARHVVNHGTYHRGELRGRCGERGYTSFEETDLALYLRNRKPESVS